MKCIKTVFNLVCPFLHPFINISRKCYSVEVYDLRMCTKENNLDRKNIKVNNSREIIICAGQMGLSFVI